MVRFTVTHHRIPDHAMALNISAGWHAHLDVLAARLAGEEPGPFWDIGSRSRPNMPSASAPEGE